jgi:hypothetical protein
MRTSQETKDEGSMKDPIFSLSLMCQEGGHGGELGKRCCTFNFLREPSVG